MNEHFMIIVPHQDDEILMTAGVIRNAVKKQIPLDVVMATNGDYGCSDQSKGQMRLRESMRGMEILGLDTDQHYHILGYADTGMPETDSFLSHLYESEDDRIYASACGTQTYGLPEKEEYHMQQHGTHAEYCRTGFKSDLKEIIWQKQPTRIYTTSEYDLHGDHSALYKFVCEVLAELQMEHGYEPELYISVIHSCAGDESWPKRDTEVFDCPERLEATSSLKWNERIRIELPQEMQVSAGEENLKRKALLQHETALEPNAVEYLLSFLKNEEIFWRVELQD